MGLPYAGALLPAEAHALAQQQPGAKLVDVRSRAELDLVGRIPGSVEIEWKSYPGMQPNPDFHPPADAESAVGNAGACSCAAAADARMKPPWPQCRRATAKRYNVLEGFEGDRDASGHRNTVGGWRAAGLPWVQS